MSRISPQVDIAFKKIFGVEENKDLLISLINSIVGVEDQVVDVTITNPYNAQNFKNDKLSILDIKATGENGKRYNIEIQISDEADYDKRALYYWAKLYTEQLKAAEGYSKLSKAIGIHILNFTSIPEVDAYHNVFHITEKKSGLHYFKNLELHTVELKKFSSGDDVKLSDLVAKIQNSLDIWAAFLTRNELLNANDLPPELDNPALKKAIEVLEVMSFKPEERALYEDHLKWLLIEASTLKKMEEKGIEIGRVEGIEIGRVEGIEIGRTETSREIAMQMLSEGISIDIISRITKLSSETIQNITYKNVD